MDLRYVLLNVQSRLSPGLLCIHWAGTAAAAARETTLLADEPGLQPLLSSVFPMLVSGLPQLMPPIQTPGRRRRGEGGMRGAGRGRQTDRAAVWLRVAKTEEVIETESQPAEQDPRHKGLGWHTHPCTQHINTHAHTRAHTLTYAHLWSKGRRDWQIRLVPGACAGGDTHTRSSIRSLAWSDGRSRAGCRQPGPEQEVCWG